MAGKMYQMVVPHEAPNGQTYWKEVGVMFPREKGGYMVRLHLLPGVSILVTEMREKEKKDGAPEPRSGLGTRRESSPPKSQEPADDNGVVDYDDIPF